MLAKDMILLSPNTFSMQEWSTVAYFDLAPVLHYDFPVPTPSEHVLALAIIIPKLLPTGLAHCFTTREFIELASCEKEIRCVLEWLSEHGYAACTQRASGRSWILTDLGKQNMRVSNTLKALQADRIMRPRLDLKLEEQDAFEMVLQLEKAGWHGRVLTKGEKVAPYIPGKKDETKVFLIPYKGNTFNKWYLMALLLADTHLKPVAEMANFHNCFRFAHPAQARPEASRGMHMKLSGTLLES